MTSTTPETLDGRCLCGAVTFTIIAPFRDVLICHCTQCAQWSGHQVAATAVADSHLAITHDETDQGEPALAWYRSSEAAKRGFCRMCGSSLFFKPLDADRTSICAGTLTQPTGLRTLSHWCTDAERDYNVNSATAPRYQGCGDDGEIPKRLPTVTASDAPTEC